MTRIAKVYFEKYRTDGYDEAYKYAKRIIPDEDEDLRELVAEAVKGLMSTPPKGGKTPA